MGWPPAVRGLPDPGLKEAVCRAALDTMDRWIQPGPYFVLPGDWTLQCHRWFCFRRATKFDRVLKLVLCDKHYN